MIDRPWTGRLVVYLSVGCHDAGFAAAGSRVAEHGSVCCSQKFMLSLCLLIAVGSSFGGGLGSVVHPIIDFYMRL